MAQVFLMGAAEDLGLGDAGIPSDASSPLTATQARNLERQLMAAKQSKATGFLSQVASGLDSSSSKISTLGDQTVQLLDAATRLKLATNAAKARVQQSLDTYRNPQPVLQTWPALNVPWTEGEMVPGVKNLHLLIGAAIAGLAMVLLLRRR